MTTNRSPRSSAIRNRARFVVLPENRFAFTAALRCSERVPLRTSAMLTVDGPPGVGKSHICEYALELARQQDRDCRTIHVTAAEFAQEWDEAAKNRLLCQFHGSYDACDLLVCEDLQGIRSRRRVQESLVQVTDQVLRCGGRVIMTTTRPVRTIPGFSRRLLNRCHGGVTAHVALPRSDSRATLLQHFAALKNVPVSAEAVQFLARELPCSPRELSGFATRLAQQSRRESQMVDLAFARRMIDEEPISSARTLSEISREVARQFGVTLRVLRSESRSARARIPRQAAMYLARELTSSPYHEIGAYFSNRTHSTVVHACQRFEERLKSDLSLPAVVESIRKSLSEDRPRLARRKPVNRSRTRRASAG